MKALTQKELQRLKLTESPIAKYSGCLKISCNSITVTADWHIPSYSDFWANKVIEMSQKLNSKKLFIVGDLMNVEMFSNFPVKDWTNYLKQEMEITRDILKRLCSWFDDIYWTVGNHEYRFIRAVQGLMSFEDFFAVLNKKGDLDTNKIRVSDYPYAVINNQIRVTHPKNYSVVKGSVANKLCEKHRMDIISTHGHFWSIAKDKSNENVVADCGIIADKKRVAYLMFTDTAHPIWNNGFIILKKGKDGKLYYYPFAEGITDWDFWSNLK